MMDNQSSIKQLGNIKSWLAIIAIIMLFQSAVLFGYLVQNAHKPQNVPIPQVKVLHRLLDGIVLTNRNGNAYKLSVKFDIAVHNVGSAVVYIRPLGFTPDCMNVKSSCPFEGNGAYKNNDSLDFFALKADEVKLISLDFEFERRLKADVDEDTKSWIESQGNATDYGYLYYEIATDTASTTHTLSGVYSLNVMAKTAAQKAYSNRRLSEPEIIAIQNAGDSELKGQSYTDLESDFALWLGKPLPTLNQ